MERNYAAGSQLTGMVLGSQNVLRDKRTCSKGEIDSKLPSDSLSVEILVDTWVAHSSTSTCVSETKM